MDMVFEEAVLLEGESLFNDGTGLVTGGGGHSYFYVNGDAEWLYAASCGEPAEFCGNTVPYGTSGFSRDPIAFTLYFPQATDIDLARWLFL